MHIASTGGRNTGARRRNAASFLPVFLLLAAFFLQSFVAATHIHGAPLFRDHGVWRLAQDSARAVQPGPQQPADDPADCPLCQAAAHNGTFFAAAMAVLLPVLGTQGLSLFFRQGRLPLRYRGHDRPQRGPPV